MKPLGICVLAAAMALLGLSAKQYSPIVIDYPLQGSIFPPEITAPTFLWRDGDEKAAAWTVEVVFGDKSPQIQVIAAAERLRSAR